MGAYSEFNAAAVLQKVEARIAENRTFRMDDVCNELSIFDWWRDTLSKSQLQEMRQFLREAIKLGYTGYVCFKVGATGCANGMWAERDETLTGHSATHVPTLYRSFTPAYRYWDVTDRYGHWEWAGKYESDEDRLIHYDRIKTIKQLEAYIEENKKIIRWDV